MFSEESLQQVVKISMEETFPSDKLQGALAHGVVC